MTRIFNYLIPIFLVYRVIQLKSTVSVLREEKLTGKGASGAISEAATRGDKAAEAYNWHSEPGASDPSNRSQTDEYSNKN